MAIELIRRPIGHKLNGGDVDAQIIDDGTGDALVYVGTGHGVSDGDYIYPETNLDSYNGYFYVDSIAYDSFKIKNSEASDYIKFVQTADATFRVSTLDHGFQCVHLPIVYELKSDLWPNNIAEETYTPVTIESFENVNGYTKLNLSVAIPGLTPLNYVNLIPPSPDYTVQGSFQIIEVVQPWSIVINLTYDSLYGFGGFQVVNYYNNYAVNVRVYAGYATGHRWQSIKPYELAATLKLIPDSNGKVKFSIAEILKGYINTRNNLTLDTLPNNTDFSVGFYIEYFETYDESNGSEITTFTGDITTDSFEGMAINAMLPFKSIDSGFMSEYILGRWLTTMDRPIAFVGRWFDISFLNQYNYFDVLILNNGAPFMTITNPGSGVIRVGFNAEAVGEYCLKAMIDGTDIDESIDVTTGVNAGTGTSWVVTPSPSVTLVASASKRLEYSYNFIPGLTYNFSCIYFRTASATIYFRVVDSLGNILISDTTSGVGAGGGTIGPSFVASDEMYKFYFEVATGTTTVSILTIDINIEIEEVDLTETICIDVIDECSPTFIDDDLRITDDSIPRIV